MSQPAFDLNWTFTRINQMLFRPKSSWQIIKTEESSIRDVFKRYLLPSLLLLPIGYLAGAYAGGRSVLSIEVITAAVAGYGAALLVLYGAAAETHRFLPRYGGACSKDDACKLVAYAPTPLYFSGFLLAIPEARVGIVGLALWSMLNLSFGFSALTGVAKSRKLELLLFALCRYVLLGALIVIAATLCIFVLNILFHALIQTS